MGAEGAHGTIWRKNLIVHTPSRSSYISTNGGELSRLISAAIVNKEFCELLLTSPKVAIATSYYGEPFHLTTEEQKLVLSIRAATLTDFAMQLAKSKQPDSQPDN